MLDLILVYRIILVAITGIVIFSALLNEEKSKSDWYIILYLLSIFIYVVMR